MPIESNYDEYSERYVFQLFIIDERAYEYADTEMGAVTKCDQCGFKSSKTTVFGCTHCIHNIYNFRADVLNILNRSIPRPIDIVIRPKNDLLLYNELDATIFFNCGLDASQFAKLHFVAKGVLINKYETAASSVDILCDAMSGTNIGGYTKDVARPPEYVSFVYITNRGCIVTITSVFTNNDICVGSNSYLSLEPRVSGCPACSLSHSLMCYNCISATTRDKVLLPATIDILNACLFKYNCEFVSYDIAEISRYIWNNSEKCLYNTRATPALATMEVLQEVIAFDQSDIANVRSEIGYMYDMYESVQGALFN